jgi:hypothetical protein
VGGVFCGFYGGGIGGHEGVGNAVDAHVCGVRDFEVLLFRSRKVAG